MCRKLLGPEAPLSKKIWIESYPSKRNPLDRLGKKRTYIYSPTMDSHIQNFQKDYQLACLTLIVESNLNIPKNCL